MGDGGRGGRVKKQGSVCEVTVDGEWKGQTRQAKGTPINTSWLPQVSRRRHRSLGMLRIEGAGGQNVNCSRHSSKNTKECHIFCRLSVSLQTAPGERVEMVQRFCVLLGSVVVDSKLMPWHSFPKRMFWPICPPINHSTSVYVTHYFSQIGLEAGEWKDERMITDCRHDRDSNFSTFFAATVKSRTHLRVHQSKMFPFTPEKPLWCARHLTNLFTDKFLVLISLSGCFVSLFSVF